MIFRQKIKKADLLNNKIAGMNKGITGQATDGINYKKIQQNPTHL